ncbi:MAG: C39 family peptidase [Lachnospiraceae bacterium]|nr:C39 family peptidase [Lachnospiraceae bacterium]
MKKRFLALVACLLTITYSGCGLARFENLTHRFDDAIGNDLASAVGDAIDKRVNGGDEFGDDVTVRILTPTPTPDPNFVPSPTPLIIATPTPMTNEPASEIVDEWVYVKSAVSVRAGWSTDFFIVGGIFENDCVHRVAMLENGWSKLAFNGTYGYCNSSYLTTEKPRNVATTHLDIMEYTYKAALNGEDCYILNVQNILQKRELLIVPEITCLAIVLKYLGYSNVTKTELAEKYLKTAEAGTATPFEAYIGDPTTYTNSYGCYAPVIVDAAEKYFADKRLDKKCVDMTGMELEDLLIYVNSGIPVITWCTTNLVATTYGDSWEVNDQKIIWRNYEHAVVVCGYNKTKGTIICADPLKGLVEYDMKTFSKRYNEQYKSACIVVNKFGN